MSLTLHTCVYCDERGRFQIINGNIPERGVIWVCADHYDGLDADGLAWDESDVDLKLDEKKSWG